jgi:hypothetical protein
MAYTRKTVDCFSIMCLSCYGWEEVCTETSRTDAKVNLRLYRENQPGQYKIKKYREKI